MNQRSVVLVDRSDMKKRLKEQLKLDPRRTAVLAIDMHRGHLDPQVATMPLRTEECSRVVENSRRLLDMARGYNMPIIHVVLQMRSPEEALRNPFWAAVERASESLTPEGTSTIARHNLQGSPQTEIIPALRASSDITILNKKRLSAFYGTDLEIVLRVHEIETLLIIGVNTNTCVLNAAFEAMNRDLQDVVVSDCVASMYGDDLHVMALEDISRCLGWVLNIDEVMERLREGELQQ